MALITIDQARQYAENAGFSGNSLATVLAITLRESGQRDAAGNYNGVVDTNATNPVSGAYGLLQFNPQAGWNVMGLGNPQATYDLAYQASAHGTNFSPWTCDTECGYPSGHGVTPVSPATVVGTNGASIGLPAGFDQLTGSYSGSPIEPVNATVPAAQSTAASSGPDWGGLASGVLSGIGNPLGFLQNIGVGVLGLVILLGGFIILAAPVINAEVVQPGIKAAKAGAFA